jgi:hypothetical protein
MPAEMRKRVEPMRTRDLNVAGCGCDCPECVDDNCADCSNADCNDAECACQKRSLRAQRRLTHTEFKEADANRRLALRVAMNL